MNTKDGHEVTMVLTNAQNAAFFHADDQMALPLATIAQLAFEGINVVGDLTEFDEEGLKQVADNLRRPAGRMPDPTIGQAGGVVAGATIPIPPFVFGAKSQARLLAATDLLKFYVMIGRPVTVIGIRWNSVIKNFSEQWKAIKETKKETQPDMPVISKALPMTDLSYKGGRP